MASRIARRIAKPMARQISRAPSPVIAYSVPWVTVALASIVPGWPLIAVVPIMPPLGFMTLLAWRQLRPGLLPVWAAVPLGIIDDLFNGQPFGCAIVLWSVTMIGLDIIEARFPWRNFLTDWLVATGLIVAYLIAELLIANRAGVGTAWTVILPQMALSVIAYPIVGRVLSWLDRWRLARFRVID